MRLKHQLFLVLLFASALMVLLMAGVGRWSFDRGFSDYVLQLERERLEPLVQALAEGYARDGDWRWILADQEAAWKALTDEFIGKRRRGRSSDKTDDPDPVKGTESSSADLRQSPRPADAGLLALDPRLLLADSTQTILIGRMRAGRPVQWQAIQYDATVVGYLGHREANAWTGSIDQVFAAQQRRSFLYAALAIIPLSALLAIVIAARLARPLIQVTDAVERIGRGEYAHRVPVTRKDEIGDLARDIDRLAATLEKNLDARQRWLAELSHELRTPVAILRGELEALQDGVQPLDQNAVASLHTESLRLTRLIDDLHALSLSDAGALDYHFETVDLRDLLNERLDAGRAGAAERSIDVTLLQNHSPLPVRADRQRLGQLVDNLLQNSLRYTDPGGTLRVTAGVASDRIVINWSDSAPGVDDKDLHRLFEPLYRVDASRNRGKGGAGLGLAIVARIIEAHDGCVSAHRSALGGLTLRISLPCSAGVAP